MDAKITPIPALKDNYIWAICNPAKRQVAIVDPGEAQPVIDYLKQHDLQLNCILVTHHHHDHTGGIPELVEKFGCEVFNTKNLHTDTVNLPELNLTLKVIAIPGHTLDHIAFYNDEILFCGDTLFAGGCGRVFEGTAEQMLHSLQQLKKLNPSTLVYCAHEYTENNLCFALEVEPDNNELQQRLEMVRRIRKNNLPSLPNTLTLELATNPFLRTDQRAIQEAVSKHCKRDITDQIEVFSELRTWKNNW